jgi:L-ascorbate metabolism protein UlaG (beta-lactamase superfamily)
MRLTLGRPDLSAYADRFDVPPADASAPVTVTWAGVTTLLVDDGDAPVLTDGFFSRPSLPRVAATPLRSSVPRITSALERLGATRLAAVTPVHTHFDHAMDSAIVADMTGARLVGGESVRHLGQGQGVTAVDVVTPGSAVAAGGFDLTLVVGHHCPPDRYPGEITAPVRQPARVSAYRCGEAWSTHLRHRASGRQLLIVGSAGYVRGALQGLRAEVVYLGVGQLGHQSADYLREYWSETVRTVGARRVVLIHWDDFFRPLDRPLRALPFAVDDLDASMRELTRLADADGVALHLPTLWQRADPWR